LAEREHPTAEAVSPTQPSVADSFFIRSQRMNWYEVVGWVGAVTVLVAYALVTKYGPSVLYHVLNVLGAAGLLVNALHHRALPSTTVNVVWAVIGFWGVSVTARRRHHTERGSRLLP
jgi:hypothetical protein